MPLKFKISTASIRRLRATKHLSPWSLFKGALATKHVAEALDWLIDQGFDHHYEVVTYDTTMDVWRAKDMAGKSWSYDGGIHFDYYAVLNDQSQAALFKLFFSDRITFEPGTMELLGRPDLEWVDWSVPTPAGDRGEVI